MSEVDHSYTDDAICITGKDSECCLLMFKQHYFCKLQH